MRLTVLLLLVPLCVPPSEAVGPMMHSQIISFLRYLGIFSSNPQNAEVASASGADVTDPDRFPSTKPGVNRRIGPPEINKRREQEVAPFAEVEELPLTKHFTRLEKLHKTQRQRRP